MNNPREPGRKLKNGAAHKLSFAAHSRKKNTSHKIADPRSITATTVKKGKQEQKHHRGIESVRVASHPNTLYDHDSVYEFDCCLLIMESLASLMISHGDNVQKSMVVFCRWNWRGLRRPP